jgi:IclR family transcriptional regulator, mhp operon transcriptional activator
VDNVFSTKSGAEGNVLARIVGPYKKIEALERGLEVLAAIGQDGTGVSILCEKTGINRTTVYRILYTLERNGYLVRSRTDHRYRLSLRARTLSDGFTDSLWVTQIALPELGELFKHVLWPGNLATFDGRMMLVRESTHRFSPLMAHRNMVGRRLPLFSSLGQAFLAFSSRSTRSSFIPDYIRDLSDAGRTPISAAEVEALFATTRKRGYAVSPSTAEKGIGGLAMPIRLNNTVLACMNVVVRDRILRSSVLLTEIVGHLEATIKRVEDKLGGMSDLS